MSDPYVIPLVGLIFSLLEGASLYLLKDRFFSFGLVDKDIHKPNKPTLPVMGVILSISIFLLTSFTYWHTKDLRFFQVGMVVALFTVFGLADDHLNLTKYKHLSLIVLTSFIILALNGLEKLNWATLFLFLPLVMFISNSVNFLAGFNGLEVGTSLIISIFLVFSLMLLNLPILSNFMLGNSFLLASFLLFNKYPAKVFVGNVGTLAIGGVFASTSLYFGFVPLMLVLLTPHLIDLSLKALSLRGVPCFQEITWTGVNEKGKLIPKKGSNSLLKTILRTRPLEEPQLVKIIWAIQAVVGLIAISFLWVIR